jgi:hypothetical protein
MSSQQLQGQLQTQHSVDSSNYIMGKHNIIIIIKIIRRSNRFYQATLRHSSENSLHHNTLFYTIILVLDTRYRVVLVMHLMHGAVTLSIWLRHDTFVDTARVFTTIIWLSSDILNPMILYVSILLTLTYEF